MPADRPVALPDALGLRERRSVWLIGGGGKTSLMFAMAHALAAEGRSVLTTTTTRIRVPTPEQSRHVVIEAQAPSRLDALHEALAAHHHVTLAAAALEPEGKLGGFDVGRIDALVAAGVADHVLVEADGSAGRPLKAHRDHEPVLSPRADLVIAVIGVDCLGAPMDDAHVHRAALFRERLALPPDHRVTAADVAAIVFHPEGYLARVGRGSAVSVFISRVDGPQAERDADRLAEALRAHDRERRLAGVLVGDVRSGRYRV